MKHSLHTTTTKNGSKILFINVVGSSSFQISTVCRAGYNYAQKDKYELPHLLEHLAFEGSTSYPEPGQISYELEKIGGWNNAFTSEQIIRYFFSGSIRNYKKITELSLEQYTQPLFTQQSIDEQVEVVNRELQRWIDDDSKRVRNQSYSKLFPDKVVFPKDRIRTLQNITKADIEKYYKHTHTRANTIFVISGDLPVARRNAIVSIIDSAMSKLPFGKKLHKLRKLNTKHLRSIETLPSDLKAQMYFGIGFISPVYEKSIDYRAACAVTSTIYNRGDGSRVFRKARAAGLAYGVTSGISNGKDYSELYIIDRTDPDLALDLFKLCIEELSDLKKGNISEQEIDRAKGFKAGEYDTEYETSRDLDSWYGPLFVDDEEFYSPQDFSKAIRRVTKQDVVDVLNKFVKKDNWIISLVGHDAKKYQNGFKKVIESID